MLQGGQLRAGRETLHFLCYDGSRVGMLEVNYFFVPGGVSTFFSGILLRTHQVPPCFDEYSGSRLAPVVLLGSSTTQVKGAWLWVAWVAFTLAESTKRSLPAGQHNHDRI